MNLRVWVWHHDWGDDHEHYPFPSREAAVEAAYSYVADCWDGGLMDEYTMPTDREAAVDLYFNVHDDCEWSNIYSETIDFPNIPALPDDEVVLTPEELAVVVMTLELGFLAPLVVGSGLAPNEEKADELIQSAYEKLKD